MTRAPCRNLLESRDPGYSRPMRHFASWTCALSLFAFPAFVSAQDDDAVPEPPAEDATPAGEAGQAATPQCAGGRVAGPETAGRCCWPGQSWNEAAARCDGPPQCPAGMVAEGDSCTQPAVAPAPTPPPPMGQPAQGGYGGYPQQGYGMAPGMGYQAPQMHEEQQPITGLIVGGSVAFGASYVLSIVFGSIFLSSSGSCSGANNSWSMFIPLVGGYMWAALDSDGCSWDSGIGDAFGIPTASVQVIGLAMLIVGALVKRTVRVPGPPPADQTSWIPRLADGPGEAGAALVWDF